MARNATMFERLGGFARVRLIVSEFYSKLLASDRLNGFFVAVDMRRLIDHQTEMVASLMGGPASFPPDHLARAHARFRIGADDFKEMSDLFCETLEDFDVTVDDIDRVRAALNSLEPYITNSARQQSAAPVTPSFQS